MKDTLRLFTGFSVQPTQPLTAAIKRTRIGADRREMEVNWVPTAGFHVTLNFLGETPRARATDVLSVTAKVCADASPFETSLRGMGAFPDERHMRVIWVGIRKSRALNELQARLSSSLVEAGFKQEERDYVPHLTIGRLRKARSGTDLVSPYVRSSFGDIKVDSISVFESVLHGPKPVYIPIENFALLGSSFEEGKELEPENY